MLSGIVLLAAFLAKCGPSEIDLAGQAFIVTQGGTNIKLGSVDIRAIEEPLIPSFIEHKKEYASTEIEKLKTRHAALVLEYKPLDEAAHKAADLWASHGYGDNRFFTESNEANEKVNAKQVELNLLEAGIQRFFHGAYWIEGMPLPVQVAKTDADGNFILRLKPGRYALAAEARRKISDETEEYSWFIWVEVRKKNQERLFLTNDNLFETFSVNCVVKPADLPLK